MVTHECAIMPHLLTRQQQQQRKVIHKESGTQCQPIKQF